MIRIVFLREFLKSVWGDYRAEMDLASIRAGKSEFKVELGNGGELSYGGERLDLSQKIV